MKGFKYSLGVCIGLLVIAGLHACEEKRNEGILSRAEMVKVLTEIYVVEDKINRLSLEPDSARKVFDMMMPMISKKTGIPDSIISRSMDYYTEHPAELEKVYTALVDSLNLKEQRSKEPEQ